MINRQTVITLRVEGFGHAAPDGARALVHMEGREYLPEIRVEQMLLYADDVARFAATVGRQVRDALLVGLEAAQQRAMVRLRPRPEVPADE